MMSYAIIQPPFTLNFREMPRKELQDYYEWFFDILPQRIDVLAEAVKQSPGFQDWQPDLMPNSLDLLGKWFAVQVETRKRTREETHNIASRSSYPIEIPDVELTNRTFSLAIDIGMYVSQVLLKNHPSLQWKHVFGSKMDVDYGQPVLIGFGRTAFNPVRIMVVLAYGLADKTKTGARLREVYDVWSQKVENPPPD